VLLAVVLIIALVSVALLGFFPGMSEDAKITQSQAYWSGQAVPFRAKDLAFVPYVAYGTCMGGEPNYLYELVIENSGVERYTLTSIDIAIGGMDYNDDGGLLCDAAATIKYGTGGAGGLLSGTAFALSPGEKVHVYIDSPGGFNSKCSGTATKIVEAEINITYTTPRGLSMKQAGTKKYAFKCSG
jgi:hypothetical protein